MSARAKASEFAERRVRTAAQKVASDLRRAADEIDQAAKTVGVDDIPAAVVKLVVGALWRLDLPSVGLRDLVELRRDYEAGYEEGFHHGRSTPQALHPTGAICDHGCTAVSGVCLLDHKQIKGGDR
ncbi:hypothetical protein [Microbacterium sp. No. 7]|uniref:hypothetical protein n=1 Tax=Microbacterium sp. No. 7 TaxID=1714373 RepID=UPI0006D13386|nr:hypothetical protein [Microbacterium sp. No. 7]ALJ22066.1 hypothetical protein AOA12_20100 [Microbacterium sp. No. 7]